jgi:hypothetical protein
VPKLQSVTVGAALETVVLLDTTVLLLGMVELAAVVVAVFHSQLPDWHTLVPQNKVPLPQAPLRLQHSPHCPVHRRPPFW